jgi:hypothetical protein
LIAAFLFVGYELNRWRTFPNRNGKMLTDVQKLCSEVPVFPGFSEVGSNESSRFDMVLLDRLFNSNASYSDVKSFYSIAMPRDRWILEEENDFGRGQLTFRKGPFTVSIFGAPTSSGFHNNYAIDCLWSLRK